MKHTILPNGNLRISVDEEDQAFLKRQMEGAEEVYSDFQTDDFLHQLFSPLIENSELEWVYPEEIGALTDAPILGIYGEPVEAQENDTRRSACQWEVNGKLTRWVLPVERAWWFPNYQVICPQEVLATKGYVDFEYGGENEEITA